MTTDVSPPQSSIILYQTEDGRTRVQCRFENETVWLTQALIAELFQTTPQNVTMHLKAIFGEGELTETATCKDFLQVRNERGREVTRSLRHYRLEAILAGGYRVGGKNHSLSIADDQLRGNHPEAPDSSARWDRRRHLCRLGRVEGHGRRSSICQQKLAALGELKKSLLHQAFTGQLQEGP